MIDQTAFYSSHLYFAFFYLEAANEMVKAVAKSARRAKDKCLEVFSLKRRHDINWEETWEQINECTHRH